MPETNEKPSKLYKYEAFTERSLQNLKDQVIYFGSPKNFNDPYDCALKPQVIALSRQEVETFRTKPSPFIPAHLLPELRSKTSLELSESFDRICIGAIRTAQANFTRHGVSCFSEVNDELLMWSHYGGKYKGFCLEFNTAYYPFEFPRKVKYSDKMPSIKASTLLMNEGSDSVMGLFSTKSKSWSYEREWRIFFKDTDTSLPYPTECLTGIYFGPEISKAALEIICLVLQSQNPHVRFWKGRRSATEFKVEFDEFTYPPPLKVR